MMNSGRIGFASVLIFLLSPIAAIADEDCPSAIGGSGHYYLSRGMAQTEILYDNTPVIHTIVRQGGQTLLETTEQEGLLQLERSDRGRRTVYTPKSDLSKLLPLKLHSKMHFEFDAREGEDVSTSVIDLEVEGADSLSIGHCTYDVVKIARNQKHKNQAWEPAVDYYSSELRTVIARQYAEPNGSAMLIKFDRISTQP